MPLAFVWRVCAAPGGSAGRLDLLFAGLFVLAVLVALVASGVRKS